jgi:hypothetical protein
MLPFLAVLVALPWLALVGAVLVGIIFAVPLIWRAGTGLLDNMQLRLLAGTFRSRPLVLGTLRPRRVRSLPHLPDFEWSEHWMYSQTFRVRLDDGVDRVEHLVTTIAEAEFLAGMKRQHLYWIEHLDDAFAWVVECELADEVIRPGLLSEGITATFMDITKASFLLLSAPITWLRAIAPLFDTSAEIQARRAEQRRKRGLEPLKQEHCKGSISFDRVKVLIENDRAYQQWAESGVELLSRRSAEAR